MSGTGKNRILRVSIDRQQGQVTVQDCERVSTALNLLLDAKDIVPGGPYFLEVSSPGIERNLKELWQFQHVVGKAVDVSTSEKVAVPNGDPHRIQGKLEAVDGNDLKVIREDGELVQIPFAVVRKAKTVFSEGKPPSKDGGKGRKKR